jgi:site-specific DNA recombinase
MAAPAPRTTTVMSPAGFLPFAFLGRTSTGAMQDPVASIRRQARTCQDALPPGGQIVAWYWDIESGGLDLDQRGQSQAWRAFPGIGIPRDGGLQDLLGEAASGTRRFSAVISEDIERAARDNLASLQLEKELANHGIPIFAADEPITIEGVNASTVLLRRVRQGFAEFFRYQIKKKTMEGLVQHSIDGWNIGPAPYGYAAERVEHPNRIKASQGRTKTRLVLDPARAPLVDQIYTWRTVNKLGLPTIAARLNASPARYPAPAGGGWTANAVGKILANPKYTGHMVYGRRRRTPGGRRVPVPPGQWTWSPEPVHPAIIDRATFDDAQQIGADHRTSRDGTAPSGRATDGRIYPYRSRVRCRDCKRRYGGSTQPGKNGGNVYYRDPYDPANPQHVAACPVHPRSVKIPETLLNDLVGRFYAERVFGPGRRDLLTAQLPATYADAAAARDAEKTTLSIRLRQNQAARKAQILAQEQLPADPADAAANEMRAAIRERFTELAAERDQIHARLAALDATAPKAADTTLLDQLPYAGDILPRLPDPLKAKLFALFDLVILWNKPARQVTIHAELTEATLQALPALLYPTQDGYHDTADHHTPGQPAPAQPAPMGDLDTTPMGGVMTRNHDSELSTG